MKSKKWLAVAGITMSAALLLAACGKTEKKADAPTTYSYVYAVDPTTLKVQHQTSLPTWSMDSWKMTNMGT